MDTRNGNGIRSAMLVIVAFSSVAAIADEPRWSVGMQVGSAHSDIRAPEEKPTEEPSTKNYDVSTTIGGKNRLGWRVFTGYRLNNYLGVQVGYTDLGTARSRGTLPSLRSEIDQPAGQTSRGADLGLQLKAPVTERLALSVRGGAFRFTQSESKAFYGAGAEFMLLPDVACGVEWTRYDVGGEPIALWTLGVHYRLSEY